MNINVSKTNTCCIKTVQFYIDLFFRILKNKPLDFGMALYKEGIENNILKSIKNKTMKMQSTRLLSPLSQESVVNLTTEVKEVLATEFKKGRDRILSTADLWNIQRQRKARVQRRYI